MNKYMKKLAAGLLTFALMVMLLPAGSLVSFAASGKLSFSDPTASAEKAGFKVPGEIVRDAKDASLEEVSVALTFTEELPT